MTNTSILLVENDPTVRHALAEYLRECGYRVIEAGDTDDAQEILANPDFDIDIVLCDVVGPGNIDGFALAKWIRQYTPGTQTILAATVSKAAKKAGDLCEDGPLLAKPYDHQLLLDRIKSTLATRDRNRPKD